MEVNIMRRKIWTDEQEQFLIDYYGKIPDNEIAVRISKKPNEIRSKAHHLRKKGKPIARRTSDKLKNPLNIEKLLDSYGGILTHKLAKEYGVGISAIYRAVKKRRVIFAANDGRYTLSEIAKVLKIDAKTVKRWVYLKLKISAYAKDGLTSPNLPKSANSASRPFHALIRTKDLKNFFTLRPEAYDLEKLDGVTKYILGLSRIISSRRLLSSGFQNKPKRGSGSRKIKKNVKCSVGDNKFAIQPQCPGIEIIIRQKFHSFPDKTG